MNHLSRKLSQISTGWSLALAFLLYVSFAAGVMPWLSTFMPETARGAVPIDLQFAPKPAELYVMVEAYGDEGRKIYALFELTADVLYPIIYATFLAIVLTMLSRCLYGIESRVTILNLLPYGIVIMDYLENIGIVTLLMSYPEQYELVARVTGFFNAAKWSLVALTFAIIMIGLVLLPFKGPERNSAT